MHKLARDRIRDDADVRGSRSESRKEDQIAGFEIVAIDGIAGPKLIRGRSWQRHAAPGQDELRQTAAIEPVARTRTAVSIGGPDQRKGIVGHGGAHGSMCDAPRKRLGRGSDRRTRASRGQDDQARGRPEPSLR